MNQDDLYRQFVNWESFARDIIDFKRLYVDMTAEPDKPRSGDPLAGLMLSQIVYYHLPDRRGHPKLHIERNGYLWLVKRRTDWWDECRLTPKKVDRCLGILGDGRQIGTKEDGYWKEGRKLIVVTLHKFRGTPQHYIRINFPAFLIGWERLTSTLPDGERRIVPILPNGESPIILPDGEDGISPDGESDVISPDGESDLTKEIDNQLQDDELIFLTQKYKDFWPEIISGLADHMTPGVHSKILKGSRVIRVDPLNDGTMHIIVGILIPGMTAWSKTLPYNVEDLATKLMTPVTIDHPVLVSFVDHPLPPEAGESSPKDSVPVGYPQENPTPPEKMNPLPEEYKEMNI